MSEFDLIRRHFAALGPARDDVLLGVGDDCARLRVAPDQELAVSIDTLVAGRHFFADCAPANIGHKALAVGLSDLAAMGAQPAWSTLALTLPQADNNWLDEFSAGFAALSECFGIRLVGGDTTRGPLSITVQVHGLLPVGTGIGRAGARSGDRIFVTGTLGDAALALRLMQAGGQPPPALRERLERPAPRVTTGQRLRGIASAMIDLSDGLAGDLGHILAASGGGAVIDLERLPLSMPVSEYVSETADWSPALAGGDDYELCFCVPPERLGELPVALDGCAGGFREVGEIRPQPGLFVCEGAGPLLEVAPGGYDHFAGRG